MNKRSFFGLCVAGIVGAIASKTPPKTSGETIDTSKYTCGVDPYDKSALSNAGYTYWQSEKIGDITVFTKHFVKIDIRD